MTEDKHIQYTDKLVKIDDMKMNNGRLRYKILYKKRTWYESALKYYGDSRNILRIMDLSLFRSVMQMFRFVLSTVIRLFEYLRPLFWNLLVGITNTTAAVANAVKQFNAVLKCAWIREIFIIILVIAAIFIAASRSYGS